MDVSRQWTHDRLGKELRSFGHRLCSARESAGLDLEDVAQQTSLSRDRIASIERGHVDPFLDEVVPLAHLR